MGKVSPPRPSHGESHEDVAFNSFIVTACSSFILIIPLMIPRPLILIDTGIIGGPGRGLIQLASYLESKQLDYLLCTFSYATPKSREFLDELHRLGLPTASIRQRSVYDPTPIYELYHIARRGRFNIIQSHGYKSHFVALIASRMLRLPWIAFAHGWTSEDRKVAVYHALDKIMLRFAECVIAVSPPLFDLFSRIRGTTRCTQLILNAVDSDLIRGVEGGGVVRGRHCIDDRQFLLGCFGRLSSEKGQDILLEALHVVHKAHPHTTLLLLGDGPERKTLQRRSEQLGLGDRICFQPHTSSIRDYYEAIDLLIVPSRSEGLPNVVLEGLSLGVPVVATNVGAIPEVLSHRETGWVVPPDSPTALAQAIQEALGDKTLRSKVAATGRDSVHERFSPIARGQKIVAAYEATLRRNTRRSSKPLRDNRLVINPASPPLSEQRPTIET